MKLLVLDCNVKYLNPTRNYLPIFLSKLGDVRFFGPGYCSTSTLESGLNEYINKNGPFDAAISTEHFSAPLVSHESFDETFRFYKSSFFFDFSAIDLKLFLDCKESFYKISIYKIALLLQFDFQMISIDYCRHLSENFALIAGLNDQFWRSKKELTGLAKENFNVVNDNWYEFTERNENKIVPILHYISDAEFSFNSFLGREYNWSVPGVTYHARKVAASILKASGSKLSKPTVLVQKSVSILNRLGLRPYSRSNVIDILNRTFLASICDSRFSYTCGSALRFPIRKFFEIPALGCVLVCDPCNGFEDIGFIDGTNAIICAPERIEVATKMLLKDIDRAEAIAKAGQKLIMEKHTLHVRAAQLRLAIEAGVKGLYRGARIKNGDIILNDSGASTKNNKLIRIP